MKFITEILKRRIPQILGSYLFAGSSLILFIDWLVARYAFSEYYVTLVLFGIVSILPSVVILAYFHGAPGKDEWTKIEKIGLPINIIFIGLVVIMGNNYGWWLGDNLFEETMKPKRLTIAPITSDNANLEYAENKSTMELLLLNKIESNNIYDELVTYLKTNNMSGDIDIYTKYQIAEESNKKGEKTKKYTFKYLQRKYNGIDDMLEIYFKEINDENSLYGYRKNTSSDFSYFPLIYKINNNEIGDYL